MPKLLVTTTYATHQGAAVDVKVIDFTYAEPALYAMAKINQVSRHPMGVTQEAIALFNENMQSPQVPKGPVTPL